MTQSAETDELSAETGEATADRGEASAETDEAGELTAQAGEATVETREATVQVDEMTADLDEASAEAELEELTAETSEASAETDETTAETSEATAETDELTAAAMSEATAEPDEATAETDEATAKTDAATPRTFAARLRRLGGETEALSRLLEREDAPESLRRFAAQALNQLLHVADLVPEGIEALGYLEAIFAFRLLAAQACQEQPGLAAQDPSGTLARLAADAAPLAQLLGDDYARLVAQVDAQRQRPARGRSASDLLDSAESRAEALAEARTWARSYRAPAFGDGSHDLVKLRAFVRTRVRRAAA